MSALQAPTRLSATAKARLVAEVARSYLRARRLLRAANLKQALVELRQGAPPPGRPVEAGQLLEGARLGSVVGRVLGPLPVESRCLTRSLVLTELLSRRSIPSRLVIGVRPGEAFGAHAWVELDGHPVLPPGGDAFARLVDL